MLLASLEEPIIQVSSQGPCLVRGPPCGQKAGLFLEEEGHHAIWAPQTVHLPAGAVYMLLGADEGVPISLCDMEIEAWRGPGPHELQRRGWELVPSGEPRDFMLLRFMRLSHSKTNPNVYFPRSK